MTNRQTSANGYVQVYTGDGKGKTTAAIGLALRALSAGKRVYIVQFIKGRASGEIDALKTNFPGADVESFGLGRFIKGTPTEEDIEAARQGMDRLREVLGAGEHQVVIADELNGAVEASLVSLEDVLELLELRPDHVELVITGRNARVDLVAKADLVTEMLKIKHYFDNGVAARKGIEY